jgi:hypothetical protein
MPGIKPAIEFEIRAPLHPCPLPAQETLPRRAAESRSPPRLGERNVSASCPARRFRCSRGTGPRRAATVPAETGDDTHQSHRATGDDRSWCGPRPTRAQVSRPSQSWRSGWPRYRERWGSCLYLSADLRTHVSKVDFRYLGRTTGVQRISDARNRVVTPGRLVRLDPNWSLQASEGLGRSVPPDQRWLATNRHRPATLRAELRCGRRTSCKAVALTLVTDTPRFAPACHEAQEQPRRERLHPAKPLGSVRHRQAEKLRRGHLAVPAPPSRKALKFTEPTLGLGYRDPFAKPCYNGAPGCKPPIRNRYLAIDRLFRSQSSKVPVGAEACAGHIMRLAERFAA